MAEYNDPTRYLGSQQNHQRIYDFERDILRVKNPLSTDFTFIYDSMPVMIPALGTKDMERYLVRRYIWNMIGHIYNQITEKKFDEFHEKFTRTHPDVIDDPYLINEKIWLKLPRADNPEFQQKIIKDCVMGVVTKFGANRVVQTPKNGQLDPNTPLFEQLINDFRAVGVADEAAPAVLTEPLASQPASEAEATLG